MSAICDHCTQGYVVPGEPKGTMIDGAYFHPAPKGPPAGADDAPAQESSRAIVVFTDIFGLPLKNCKIIADELAARVRCDVWVPDLFDGNPPFMPEELVPILPDTGKPDDTMTLRRRLSLILLAIVRAMRLYRARNAAVDPRAAAFIRMIRNKHAYERVGAVGYCFGGALAIRLGSADVLDSIVVCHPSHRDIDAIRAINVPASWACAEADSSFTPALRAEAEAVFAAREGAADFVEYEFKDYPGTVHGFAARPNLAVPGVYDAFKGALEQAGAWFDRTL